MVKRSPFIWNGILHLVAKELEKKDNWKRARLVLWSNAKKRATGVLGRKGSACGSEQLKTQVSSYLYNLESMNRPILRVRYMSTPLKDDDNDLPHLTRVPTPHNRTMSTPLPPVKKPVAKPKSRGCVLL